MSSSLLSNAKHSSEKIQQIAGFAGSQHYSVVAATVDGRGPALLGALFDPGADEADLLLG